MSSVFDIDCSLFIERWPHILIAFSHIRQGSKYIQPRDSPRRSLNAFHLRGNGVSDFTEHIIFQRRQFVLRVQYRIFQLFKSRRRISFRIGERLFTDIIFWYKVLVGISYFKIIAEYFIILNSEIFNSGTFTVFLLKRRQPVFAVCFRFAQGINRFVESFFDHTAVSDRDRRFFDNSAIN